MGFSQSSSRIFIHGDPKRKQNTPNPVILKINRSLWETTDKADPLPAILIRQLLKIKVKAATTTYLQSTP
jgi:hypothetical protein